MSKSLLLEIGLEEVPARFMRDAVEQLEQKTKQWLDEARIAYERVQTYGTPRRLAVFIEQIGDKQADMTEEVRGPSQKAAVGEDGQWSKAALGFARGQGVDPEQLFYKEVNGVQYVFASKYTAGVETETLLPDALQHIIQTLSFPKTMRWGANETKFIRPIRWLVALYEDEIVPLQIANVKSNRVTRGHRFLGDQHIVLDKADEYVQLLREQYVYVDIEERKALIVQQIKAIEAKQGWVVPIEEDLIEEVLFLVEYPTALYGSFQTEFLDIPQEVLITSMREHQRYFPVLNDEGALQPYFITVRNGNDVSLDRVVKGNEKVLRARLSDARFFYQEDQQLAIDDALSRLDKVTFQEELGSIGDKVRRVQEIATHLAAYFQLDEAVTNKIQRAAAICKFDLVTQMVNEFPELQGVMGEDYALKANEDSEVARAINEHYQPRFSGDNTPASVVGAVVSIADKIDTITGCFLVGIVPTGSHDPYALRRQAAGIIQTLRDHQFMCPPSVLFNIVLKVYEEAGLLKKELDVIRKELHDFLLLRVKNLLSSHVRYDVADALLAQGYDHISALLNRGIALMEHIEQMDEQELKADFESFVRVMRIAAQSEHDSVDPALFTEQVEHELYDAFQSVAPIYEQHLNDGQAGEALRTLGQLQQPINQFFEQVMVMVDDEQVKNNRLALLFNIAKLFRSFADFQKIVW